MVDLFMSSIEPLIVKKVTYRLLQIPELITRPSKLQMLYIGRKGEWRQVVNEGEMIGNITTQCGHAVDFKKVFFDRKTHREQILSMRNTDILLGYHGAAFVNIMFMMPFSGFIELFSPTARLRYYDMMALKTQLHYRCLTKNRADRSKKLPRDGRNINIIVDVDKVVQYVNELVEVVDREKYKIVNVI